VFLFFDLACIIYSYTLTSGPIVEVNNTIDNRCFHIVYIDNTCISTFIAEHVTTVIAKRYMSTATNIVTVHNAFLRCTLIPKL